jgi:hypothetical protein
MRLGYVGETHEGSVLDVTNGCMLAVAQVEVMMTHIQ